MFFYAILGEFGRDSVSGGRRVGVATNGGRDAVGSGRGAAPDAADAAPAYRTPWRPLSVRGRRPRLRRGREDPRRSTVENGAGTGTAVCDRGPCTPVDAAVDLDVVWSPGVPPAGS